MTLITNNASGNHPVNNDVLSNFYSRRQKLISHWPYPSTRFNDRLIFLISEYAGFLPTQTEIVQQVYSAKKQEWFSLVVEHLANAVHTDLMPLIGEYHGFLPTKREINRLITYFDPQVYIQFVNQAAGKRFYDLPIAEVPLTRFVPESSNDTERALLVPGEIAAPVMRTSLNEYPFLVIGYETPMMEGVGGWEDIAFGVCMVGDFAFKSMKNGPREVEHRIQSTTTMKFVRIQRENANDQMELQMGLFFERNDIIFLYLHIEKFLKPNDYKLSAAKPPKSSSDAQKKQISVITPDFPKDT